MHELTIAQNIIDIIVDSLPGDEYNNAESVKIKIGLFSNVLPEALTSSFDVLKKEHYLENTKLEIDIVPLVIKCQNCMQTISTNEILLNCYYCNSDHLEVLNGDVLELSEIILSENS